MIEAFYRPIKYLLILLIAILLGAKYYSFAHIERTGTDAIAANLQGLKKHFPKHSVGFYTNLLPDSATQLYFRTQLVVQPVIIDKRDSNTVLVVLDKKLPARQFKGYTVLATSSDSSFSYSLLKRIN